MRVEPSEINLQINNSPAALASLKIIDDAYTT